MTIWWWWWWWWWWQWFRPWTLWNSGGKADNQPSWRNQARQLAGDSIHILFLFNFQLKILEFCIWIIFWVFDLTCIWSLYQCLHLILQKYLWLGEPVIGSPVEHHWAGHMGEAGKYLSNIQNNPNIFKAKKALPDRSHGRRWKIFVMYLKESKYFQRQKGTTGREKLKTIEE